MTSTLDKVLALADFFEANAHRSEAEGKVPDDVAAAIKSTGVIRMLQPKEYGGEEAHPVDFLKAVYNIGIHDGSAGWIAGVVAVHAHELAQGDRRLQDELWKDDNDTWIASPYAPMGRAKPVEGGYILNGRWPFSSGTDHCQWVTIGGLIVGEDGKPVDGHAHHFQLPRSDYEIDHESWHVMGLKGTGSKDLVVTDAFVPDYRVIDTDPVTDGTAAVEGRESPLYKLPRNMVFSGTITAATLALAKSVLDSYVKWTADRSNRFGKASADHYQLFALGAAAADVDASLLVLFNDLSWAWDEVSAGRQISYADRARIRRNQVRASTRAVNAADSVFRISGGSQLQSSLPMQRRWRDAQAAMHHVQNLEGPVYYAFGMDLFGHQLENSAVKV